MSCVECNTKINRESHKIDCSICRNIFHPSCVSLKDEDVQYMRSERKTWQCSNCLKKLRSNKGNDDRLASPKPVMVNKEVNENENPTLLRQVLQEITQFKSWSAENQKKLDDRFQLWDKIMERMEYLTSENSFLKTECRKLEQKIDYLEQQQHENSIELVGVEVAGKENINEIILNVTNKGLNLALTENDIDFAYRRKAANGKPSNIIYVKFCSRRSKHKVLQAKRNHKRLSTASCGFNSDGMIYLNEALSYTRRQLFIRAKTVKADLGYKYLWIQNSRILMRKVDGGEVIVVNDMIDLDKLN